MLLSSDLTAKESFEIPKPTVNINPWVLGWVRDENLIPQVILEKILQTNLEN